MKSREARKSRTIQRLRVLLLLALIATVAVVSTVFVRRLGEEQPSEPEPVGPESVEVTGDMVTVGEGFERTVTEGDQPRFTVRGESYAVDRNGQVYLDGVDVTVFGDGEESYSIRSPKARFRPEKREARLTGGVDVSGPDGLSMETETLLVMQRGRVIQSRGQIYVRMGNRVHARADRLRVLLRAQQFRMMGRARVLSLEEAPAPFELTSQEIVFDRSRHLIEALDGPAQLTHRQDWLTAGHVTVFLDEEERRVRYVRAEDIVVAEVRSAAALGGPEDETASEPAAGNGPVDDQPSVPSEEELSDDPLSRTPPRQIEDPSGLSRLRIHTARFEMEMSGDGRHPSALEAVDGPGGVAVLRSFSAGGGPVHRLRAPRIDGRFEEGVPAAFAAEEEITLVVVEGGAEGSAEEEMAAELEAWKAGAADEEGSPGDGAMDDGPERRARARRAEALFDEAGELSTVTLLDRVVITDPAPEGETRARGEKGVFRTTDDTLEITGNPAQVRTPRVQMDAPTLEYGRADGILHGTGNVRARMDEVTDTSLGGTPLAEGEGPLWVEAEEGFFRDTPRSFLFRGSVRAWRGEDLLTADELRGDDAEQRLLARGAVRTVWRAPEGEGTVGEEGGPIEVTAEQMRYREGRRLLLYIGDVVAKQQGREVACQEMELFLTPEDAKEGGEIERMVCTGDVRVTEPGGGAGGAGEDEGARTLQGHRAIYLPAERTVEVLAASDGVVTMKDPEGNVIEGPRMIYEIDRERVQVLPRAGGDPEEGGDDVVEDGATAESAAEPGEDTPPDEAPDGEGGTAP